MHKGLLVAVVTTAGLAVAGPAVADPAMTVTATGTKEVKVVPKNRKSNASIEAAVQAAQRGGVGGAMNAARENALRYAAAAGLTLGSIVSVSDAENNGGYSGPYEFFGPFGPDRYCGVERRAVIKVVNGKRKVVRTRKVHTCIVPPFEATTLTVTYAAS